MRTVARWFLLTVLAVDVAFAAFFFLGGPLSIGAEPENGIEALMAAREEPAAESPWSRQALEELGRQLEARAADIERREVEIEELLRSSEVLRRAGLSPDEQAAAEPTAAPEPEEEDSPRNEAFQRLQQAYENMEPDSAAQALAQLAERDKEAVVELLLGWRPRTSGAILDSLTQANPGLAADLSYEIWKRSGKSAPGGS